MGYSQITVVGNVGKVQPLREVRREDGTFSKVLNFTVNDGSQWYNVAVWGNYAEALSKFIAVGHPVTVIGTFKVRLYDAGNNVAAASVDITADVVQDMARKENSGTQSTGLRFAPATTDSKPEMATAPKVDTPAPKASVAAPKGKNKKPATVVNANGDEQDIPF